jgi:hypothetical protein
MIGLVILFIILAILTLSLAVSIYEYIKINKLKKQFEFLMAENLKLKKLSDSQVQVNHRKSFRLQVGSQSCTLQLIEFGDEKLEKLKNKKVTGYIQDISATGLKFVTEYNLPIRKKISVNLNFEMKDQLFTLKADIVRKEEQMDHNNVVYGIKFNNDEINESKLVSLLNQIQLEQRRKYA